MTIPLAIQAFFAQGLFVFLLGTQTANIRDKNKRAAFFTSLCIAVPEVTVLSSIVKSAQTSGSLLVYTSFAVGGACGVTISMFVSDLRERRINRSDFDYMANLSDHT